MDDYILLRIVAFFKELRTITHEIVIFISMHFSRRQLECPRGYFGFNCKKQCRYPTFGDRCKHTCDCKQNICDHKRGCVPGRIHTWLYKCIFNYDYKKFIIRRLVLLCHLHKGDHRNISLKSTFNQQQLTSPSIWSNEGCKVNIFRSLYLGIFRSSCLVHMQVVVFFLIKICPLSVVDVVVVVVNFLHLHLLLQNHWANFNQTWHKASFGEEDSSLFKGRAPPFSKGG